MRSIDHNEFHCPSGKEHYKLLSHISTFFNNAIILDIGSHRGASATALSYNSSNKIYSFDIEDRIVEYQDSPKSIENINFHIMNIFENLEDPKWKNLILDSSLIFLDIDPHEGNLEYQFYLWLERNNYQGIIIFDDIHYFQGMKDNLWNKIDSSKREDITHLGHWSGTGIVQFNKKFSFEENVINAKSKLKVMAVTGFVPNGFPAQHLSVQKCMDLGNKLKESIPGKIHAFEPWNFEDCWASKFLKEDPNLMPSDINPPKDRYLEPGHAARSNIILLQRYEWMRMAAELYPDVDVFAWIEYTVMKQRNVSPEVVQQFISSLEEKEFDSLSLPGCWEKGPINDSYAHWRFCGSVWVCPRKYIFAQEEAIKTVVSLRTKFNKTISWDMNSMAYVELLDILPIRWYNGNHDETQFTNY